MGAGMILRSETTWHKYYVRHQKDPKQSSCFGSSSKFLYSIWMLFSVFISKDLPKIDWLESWFNRKAKKVSFVLFLRKLSPRGYVKMHHCRQFHRNFVDVVINKQLCLTFRQPSQTTGAQKILGSPSRQNIKKRFLLTKKFGAPWLGRDFLCACLIRLSLSHVKK